MTDDGLAELLRAAVPPVGQLDRARDAWPQVVGRIEQVPPWSLIDLALAAAAAVALMMNPEWIWLLAYHL